MRKSSKIAAAAVVATIGLGASASAASAYDITGGNYIGTNGTNAQTFQVGGGFTVSCSKATYTGNTDNVPGDTNSTLFTPVFGTGAGGTCTLLGQPATVSTTGQWKLTVTGGSGSTHTGSINLPSTSTTTISAVGCTVTVPGGQTFANGVGGTTASSTTSGNNQLLNVRAAGITYTASGCPFASGSTGVYNTNGNITIASSPAGTPIAVTP